MPDPRQHVPNLQLYPSAMTSADWSLVEPAIRNTSFFSARVEDERILSALQQLVAQGIDEGLSVGEFIRRALEMLDNMERPADYMDRMKHDKSMSILRDSNRLRLIFRTQAELAAGYAKFCKEFEPWLLNAQPGWRFVRQPGAKTRRQDHEDNRNKIRLKTDIDFWLARNSPDFGGFDNPYPPFGFNSWMRVFGVDRDECEKLGLIKPGEQVTIPARYAEWNLPHVIRSIGTASTDGLDEDAIRRIIDDCTDEGITVEQGDGELHVVPGGEDDPLTKMEDEVVDQWTEQEAASEPQPEPPSPQPTTDQTPEEGTPQPQGEPDFDAMTEEELLRIILGDEEFEQQEKQNWGIA